MSPAAIFALLADVNVSGLPASNQSSPIKESEPAQKQEIVSFVQLPSVHPFGLWPTLNALK